MSCAKPGKTMGRGSNKAGNKKNTKVRADVKKYDEYAASRQPGFLEAQRERLGKLPKTGKAVQKEFRDFVKYYTGADLEPAINPFKAEFMNGNKSYFAVNVDKIEGKNGLGGKTGIAAIQKLQDDKVSPFNINVSWDGKRTESGSKVYTIEVSKR